MKKIYHITPALILLFAGNALAQEQPKKTVFEEDVDIVKPYKPKLSDAVKIDVAPMPETLETKKPDIAYKTPAALLKTTPARARLSAVAIDKGKVARLNHNYVKAGFGNYSTAYAEAFYNTLRNRTSLLAVHGRHFSGNGPVASSRFSENLLDIYGKHLMGKHTLTADIGYSRNANSYYAVMPKPLSDLAAIGGRQVFNDIHLDGMIENTGADTGKFRYGLGAGFFNFSDLQKTSENDFTLKGYAIETFMGNELRFDVVYDFMRYKQWRETSAVNRTLLQTDVHYNFLYDRFRASAGLKTASQNEPASSRFHVFPDLKIETDIIEKYLTVYGHLTGGVKKQTYRGFAYVNPWISDPELRNTVERLRISAGAKGSFSSRTSFLLGVNYSNLRDLPIFLNDSSNPRVFVTDYDQGATLTQVQAGLGYAIGEDAGINASINVNRYTMSKDSLRKPYHLPALDATLTGFYNIADKVHIGADLFFVGERYGKVQGYNEYKLPSYLDLNAYASYAFTNVKGLKAHLEAKNILGNRYQRWNFYPVRGFQIMGGLSLSFL